MDSLKIDHKDRDKDENETRFDKRLTDVTLLGDILIRHVSLGRKRNNITSSKAHAHIRFGLVFLRII